MYEEFYKLRAKPFRLSPDPGFFFASRGHKRALAYLRYGLKQSEGFVVITGEPGTGKTTLAQILLAEMDQSDVVVAHLTTTQLEADDMLRMVAASFGLRYEGLDKAGLLKTLEAFLLARSRERKRALLVVDEAQNLPPRSLEELRMLSNLQVGDHALFQTFLLGQAQFRQMLDHPDLEQLRQRVIANYHLTSLAPDECQSYVESRLSHVGWKGDPKFTDDAYEIIFNYTAGIPRRINMLCDRVMLFGCLEERHVIDKEVLNDVTDELQSEISGRRINPVEFTDGEQENPDEMATLSQGQYKQDRSERVIDTKPDIDKIIERETQANEVADIPDSPEKHEIDRQKQHEVHNQKSVSSQHVTEPPVILPEPISENRRNNAQSDQAWGQSVARRKQDEDIESVSEDEEDNKKDTAELVREKNQEKDRFRVIAGGKVSGRDELRENVKRELNRQTSDSAPAFIAAIPDAPGDSEEVSLRKALRLVLAYHRSPRSFPGLDDPSQPIPKGMHALLALATSEDATIKNMRQIAAMGISPAMLKAAVRYYVRRVLFTPGADDFRVLGLAHDVSLSDVEEHYGFMMKLMRMDNEDADETGVARIGQAYENLCRGDVTHNRNANRIEPTIGETPDVDSIDELDLDLSPNAISGKVVGRRIAPEGSGENIPSVIGGKERSGPTLRNIMLLLGAAVIIAVIYLTQFQKVNFGIGISSIFVGNETIAKSNQTETIPSKNQTQDLMHLDNSSMNVKRNEASEVNDTKINDISKTENINLITPAQDDSAIPKDSGSQVNIDGTISSSLPAQNTLARDVSNTIPSSVDQINKQQSSTEEPDSNQQLIARLRAEAEAEAQAKKEIAETKAIEEAKARAEAEAKIEAEALARKKAEAEAKAKAAELERIRAELKQVEKSQAIAKAKAEQEAKARAEAELRANLEAEAKMEAISKAKAEELAKEKALLAIQQKDMEETERLRRENVQIGMALNADGSQQNDSLVAIVANENQTVAQVENRIINQVEIDDSLKRLQMAYEKGDIDGFVELFTKNARTSSRTDLAGIRNEYQAHFDATNNRKIDIREMEWKLEENFASGNGTFEAIYHLKEGNQDVKRTGGVIVQLENTSSELKITRMYFSGTDGMGIFP